LKKGKKRKKKEKKIGVLEKKKCLSYRLGFEEEGEGKC
jgi:hypothetical protein